MHAMTVANDLQLAFACFGAESSHSILKIAVKSKIDKKGNKHQWHQTFLF